MTAIVEIFGEDSCDLCDSPESPNVICLCDKCVKRLHDTTGSLLRQIRTERNKASGRVRP